MNKQTISVRLHPEHRRFAERIADAEDRTLSNFVQQAIEAAINSKVGLLSAADNARWKAIRKRKKADGKLEEA